MNSGSRSCAPRDAGCPAGASPRKKTLSLFRERVGDRVELFGEAHREHLVGFVEDERFDVRRVERAAANVIEHAARRSDDDLRAALERVDLFRSSTRRRRCTRGWRPAIFREPSSSRVTGARARASGTARAPERLARAAPDDAIDQRQAERGRFAGARARLHDDALSRCCGLEDRELHRRRLDVPERVDRRANVRRERERVECRPRSGFFHNFGV